MENKVSTEEQRIEREAAEKYPATIEIAGIVMDDMIYPQKREAYIAGATKEAERCNLIVYALKMLCKEENRPHMISIAKQALQDYNQK